MPPADLTNVGSTQTRRRTRRRTRARTGNGPTSVRTGAGTGIGGGSNVGAIGMSSDLGKLSAREQLVANRTAESICHFYGLPVPNWTGRATR